MNLRTFIFSYTYIYIIFSHPCVVGLAFVARTEPCMSEQFPNPQTVLNTTRELFYAWMGNTFLIHLNNVIFLSWFGKFFPSSTLKTSIVIMEKSFNHDKQSISTDGDILNSHLSKKNYMILIHCYCTCVLMKGKSYIHMLVIVKCS